MPGTSDAIAITTEDIQYDTMTPEDAYKTVQDAMRKGQEALDAVPASVKKMAQEYSEGDLVKTDFDSYGSM